jgi:hypothetical protein
MMAARILAVLVVGLVLVVMFPAAVLSHDPPPPPPPPDHPKEGCTPGYWKQEHHQPWTGTGYSPSQTLSSVFTIPSSLSSFAGWTLDRALDGGGGSGLSGAAQILFRAAVAALLNAAHPNVDYGFSAAAVISTTNSALASGSRTDILNQAAEWDRFNNLGCPLN